MGPQDAIAALTVDASGREVLPTRACQTMSSPAAATSGTAVKLVEEEPGMTGNFSRPSAVVIDYDNSGCVPASMFSGRRWRWGIEWSNA